MKASAVSPAKRSIYIYESYLGHLCIGVHSGFAVVVVLIQVDGILVLGEDESLGRRVYDTVEDFGSGLDVRDGLERHLADAFDTRTDDGE